MHLSGEVPSNSGYSRAHPLRAVWLAPASRFAMRDAVDDVATARLLLVVRLIVYTCWWSLHVLVVHPDVCAAEKVRQRNGSPNRTIKGKAYH